MMSTSQKKSFYDLAPRGGRAGRRVLLRDLGALGGALALGSGGLLSSGCAAVTSGDHDLSTFFVLKKTQTGKISGWTQIDLDSAPGPEDQAVLKRVALYAPEGLNDLTFIQSMVGQVTAEGASPTEIVRGSNFPKDDTIAQMQIVYKDNIRPFFSDKSIRIDWTGQYDPTFPFPATGFYRIDALITVEVL